MLDNMSNGRIIAGFAPGGGPENYNYDIPSVTSRERFWEAMDLVVRAWTDDGPFNHEGHYYPLRYVNPWPKPTQKPHPPIWVPGFPERVDADRGGQARLLLFPVFPEPRGRDLQGP